MPTRGATAVRFWTRAARPPTENFVGQARRAPTAGEISVKLFDTAYRLE
jgi:hypothetical protein